jgi:hypothetical protein
MKQILINGKKNIKKINDPYSSELIERNNIKDIDETHLYYDEQISYINKLFLEEDCIYKILILRELEKKRKSYKYQDIDKNIYNENNIINLSDIIEKLVASKLKCYYCKEKIMILYKRVREDYQWTLDRVDNDIGHSCENTIIACLKCNIQRRRINKDAFLFTKQLKIYKQDC